MVNRPLVWVSIKSKAVFIGLLRRTSSSASSIPKQRKSRRCSIFSQGEVSPVIKAHDGFHLFKLIEKRQEMPFESVNKVMDKGALRDLVDLPIVIWGPRPPLSCRTGSKTSGISTQPKAGFPSPINDMIIRRANGRFSTGRAAGDRDRRQYTEGLITQGEKYQQGGGHLGQSHRRRGHEMMEAMKNAPVYDDKASRCWMIMVSRSFPKASTPSS